uniref:Cation efflux protein transmembrane domain-containing protein n=1 Tax=Aplanochytrium stocchinoi TaxID=215587 RepID=A0A7S3LS28_9STRA|mmetsp:Transcript_613/g.820  ORF Transcript_613/g.820 Transcript_613/m.820 type:complete len:480 (+) Transcript_613:204-1643(+)
MFHRCQVQSRLKLTLLVSSRQISTTTIAKFKPFPLGGRFNGYRCTSLFGFINKNNIFGTGGMNENDIIAFKHFSTKSGDKNEKDDGNKNIWNNTNLPNPSPNEAHQLGQPSWNAVVRALFGNCIITVMKFGVAFQTGSSAMFSEAIHTLADCGNQVFLLKGLSEASNAPDRRYQYGYGKAAFFWALLSALGMFWTGAGVSVYHGAYQLLNPPIEAFEPGLSVWGVLGVSFLVDGYVLKKTLADVNATKPAGVTMRKHLSKLRDPFVLAVILEDFAACTGVVIASAGIAATHITGDIFWDSLASIGIGGVLGVVAVRLVRMNQQFLLGQSVDKEILDGIRTILKGRNAIESVYEVQSQWIGPSTFAYKAEVDFDGSYLAAHLQKKYQPRFERGTEPLDVLLSWYAEDVTRLVEREVREAEQEIKKQYPGAAFIELEPDSRNADSFALPKMRDSFKEATEERRSLNRFIRMVDLSNEISKK